LSGHPCRGSFVGFWHALRLYVDVAVAERARVVSANARKGDRGDMMNHFLPGRGTG